MFMMMPLKKYYRPLKRILSSSFLLLFLCGSLFAQRDKEKSVALFGITGGLNTSQIFNDDYFGFHQFGVFAGPSFNLILRDSSSFQITAALSQKGCRMAKIVPGSSAEYYILRTNYIELPFIYMHRFKRNPFHNVHAEIGLYPSILINYFERNQVGEITPPRPFNRFEAGGMIGFGYWLKEGLYVSLRGFNSLMPVRKHQSNTRWFLNNGQYNTVVQFSFHYYFNTKEKESDTEEQE